MFATLPICKIQRVEKHNDVSERSWRGSVMEAGGDGGGSLHLRLRAECVHSEQLLTLFACKCTRTKRHVGESLQRKFAMLQSIGNTI